MTHVRTCHVSEHVTCQNMSRVRTCHVSEHVTCQNMSRVKTCRSNSALLAVAASNYFLRQQSPLENNRGLVV